MTSDNNKLFMGLAIELAQTAFENNEVPVGAVVVQNRNSEILAAFSNQMRATGSSLAHAEMLALQKAMEILKNERLVGCDMYVSLEPCPMCAYAAREVGISQLIFGLANNKTGACGSVFDIARDSRFGPPLEVTSGDLASECQALLRAFFEPRRETR